MQETIKKRRSINILMVEDNAMDALLTGEILSESEENSYELSTVKDGMEALAFLRRIDGFEHAPLPDLVILDLNLPRMNGFDFLVEFGKDERLSFIPVVILTTSEAKRDIERAKELKVISYLIKPLELEEFEESISGIKTR